MATLNKNPLQQVGLFAAPESKEDLQRIIESYPQEQRANLTQVMCFTWNYASKCVANAMKENEA